MDNKKVAAVAERRRRLVEELRDYGATYNRYGRAFATWMGLHSTDADALVEIVNAEQRGEPLTPARLAARIALTSGATATLLNRLERVGHIVRSREHHDRRLVTLRTGPHVHRCAEQFFGPLARRLDTVMTRYPPEVVQQFQNLIAELHTTMNDHLDTGDFGR
ncbi:MarR family winged helix-turn-helix transcriptional regulator [Mycobacterium sp.]|uniref:MarR family winged helix-turn-helix transcriptional regulator n=1 Tax=Mycobacterium sp. TaxID=1785 RepID=UPI003D096A35